MTLFIALHFGPTVRDLLTRIRPTTLAFLILGATSAFIVGWFWFYFTDGPIASVDLPSHIAIAEQYRLHWWKPRWFFYDSTTFTGYPALHFYGFLPVFATTVLSYAFDMVSADPVRLATHVILVFGLAILPWTFFRVIRAVASHASRDGAQVTPLPLIALVAALASFWFINHEHQWFGIGAAAVMNIGLFAQLFAWHFLLLMLASLCDEVRGVSSRLWLWWAGCLVSHLITSVFAGALLLFSWFWFQEKRRKLTLQTLVGIGVASFWLLPCAWYLGDFTAYDVYRPKGDFLEVFYRYPLWGLWNALKSAMHGEFSSLEITYFLWMGCTIAYFFMQQFRNSRLFVGLLIFVLVALLVFSSGFIATSLPLGLHYYRFIGYCFLLWTVLLAAVLVNLWANRGAASIWNSALVVIVLCCFISVTQFPHYEREKIKTHRTTEYLSDQEAVLQYFASLQDKGRVYVEYLADYSLYPPLTAHYIPSNLWRRTGFETGVSSHLQESIAYRMYVVTANRLGAKTYNVPLLFVERATGDDEFLVSQLIEYGFTHIVAARKEFVKRVEPFAVSEPQKFGIYTVIPIAATPLPMITEVRKIPIGYYDASGTLPFRLVEYYFHSRVGLSKLFELIELPDLSTVPAEIPLLLINRTEGVALPPNHIGKSRRLEFDYSRHYTLTHYNVHYPHNLELDRYHSVEAFFDSKLKLIAQLRRMASGVETGQADANPKLARSEDGEQFALADLTPHRFYRVNYSYFPYWQVRGGRLFRGQGERIFVLPEATSMTLQFEPWRFGAPILGAVITLLSLILVGWVTHASRGRRVGGAL